MAEAPDQKTKDALAAMNGVVTPQEKAALERAALAESKLAAAQKTNAETNKQPPPKGKPYELRGSSGNAILFIVYLGGFLLSIFLFCNSILISIHQSFFSGIIADQMIFLIIAWVLIGLCGVAFARHMLESNTITGIIVLAVIAGGLFIGSMVFSNLVIPSGGGGLMDNQIVRTITCIFSSLGNLAGGNAQSMQDCMNPVPPSPKPIVEKKGSSNIIDFKFGSEYTDPSYTLPNIQGDDTHIFQYMFPITVENPSDTEVVNSFTILNNSKFPTVLYNESGNKNGKIANLVPNLCENQSVDVCNISASEKLMLSMDSGGDYDVSGRVRTLNVIVSTKVSYSVEGDNDFILARSQQDMKNVKNNGPTTGSGPVDVTVYFSPNFYASGSRSNQVYLFINIANSGSGRAYINEIHISQLNNKYLSFDTTFGCKLSTGEVKSTEDIDANGIQLLKEQTHICRYTVTNPVTDVPFVTVPFMVKVDYDYDQSFTQTDIPIERMEVSS